MRQSNVLQGTLIVGVAFAATALSVGASQYSFSLFITPLEATFGWSRTEISASLSFAAVSGLAAPFLGRAMDRFGARPILVLSLCVGGISFGLRPLITDITQWYVLSFVQFITFAGATVLPMGKLVATWFARTRGRVMGFAAMGNNVGGLLVPPAIVAILGFATWREGYLALAGMSFALALVALLVVKERPPADPAPGFTPESTPEFTGGAQRPPTSVTTALRIDQGATVSQAIRSRAFYAVLVAITLGSFTYSTMLPHMYAHLVTSGMTAESASFSLGTLAVGGIAGKLIFGILAERIGARRAAIINLTGQAGFAIALGLAGAPYALVALTPVFGVCMGGFGVLIALLVQDSFGLRFFGSIMGLINTSNVVSFGFGPVIAGASYDMTGSYSAGFIVTAGLFAVGAVVLLTLELSGVRPRWQTDRTDAP